MTKERSIEMDCLKCGEKKTVTPNDRINVSLDPTLKNRLFNGEINSFKCEKRQAEAFAPMPLLYHDMDKPFLVQYYIFHPAEDRLFENNIREKR